MDQDFSCYKPLNKEWSNTYNPHILSTSKSVYHNLEIQHRKLTPHKRNNSLKSESRRNKVNSNCSLKLISLDVHSVKGNSIKRLPILQSATKDQGIINIKTDQNHSQRKTRKIKKIVNIDIYKRKRSKAAIIMSDGYKMKHVQSVKDMENKQRSGRNFRNKIRWLAENRSKKYFFSWYFLNFYW